MKEKHFLKGHYKRLLTEGILKSVIFGVAVCFGVNFICAFLYWMFAIGGIWLGIGVGSGAGLLSGILSYRFIYRLTDRSAAHRIDRYGLEERMITMLELKDDESYIAELQRKDAEESIDAVPSKRIKFRLSAVSLILAALALSFGGSMITLGVLAEADVIPYGIDLLNPDNSFGKFSVVYETTEGGRIVGESEQSVESGSSTSPVRAVADEGWIFVRWDDGERYPERYETDVKCDTVIKAVFERIDKDAAVDDEEDMADDLPYGAANNESGGGNSDEEGGENPEQGDSGQGGGKWQDKNQFIDGATYYRDYLDLYYQYAMNIFESGSDIPQDIIEFFEIYFSGI